MKTKGERQVALRKDALWVNEWRERQQSTPTTGDLYGCETKGVAGKGICKSMKTKGKQIRGSKFEVGSSSCRTDRDLEGIPTRVGRDVHSLL